MSSIITYPDPRLRMPCYEVSQIEITSSAFNPLIKAMFAELDEKGVGIAAPQLGILARLLIIQDTEERMKTWSPERRRLYEREPYGPLIAFNPVIKHLSEENELCPTGCLSIPGRVAIVKYRKRISIEYTDLQGDRLTQMLTGYTACIAQHEVDHLDGKLYIDSDGFLPDSLMREDEFRRDWADKSPDEYQLAFVA